MATCYSCKFWYSGTSKVSGRCRFFPPVLAGDSWEFPQTFDYEWCGQYQQGSSAEDNIDAILRDLGHIIEDKSPGA